MDMTRKRFLRSLAGSTVAVLIQGCGGGGGGGYGGTPAPMPSPSPAPTPSPSPSPSPSTTCASSGTAISGNHGHEVTIPSADLNSTTPMTYHIQGVADHDHTITLTVAQLVSLKTPGASVTVTSSTTAFHAHDVTVTCV